MHDRAVNRRELMSAISGGAIALTVVAEAARADAIKRIAVLMPYAGDDRSAAARIEALRSGLHELGWVEGRNLQLEYRYAPNLELLKSYAAELARMTPDLLLTTTNLATITLHRETRTIPILFVGGGDMIAEGLVASLARPNGNVTGFTNFEPATGGKWLQLLAEIAPKLRRAGFLHNPETLANIEDMHSAESAAASFKLTLLPLGVRGPADIERTISEFAAEPSSGLIVAPNPVTIRSHDLIVGLAAQHNLPAIYPFDFYAKEGGLVSYGPDQVDMFRRSASYVDRILKGVNPGELPLQTPTKFQLMINMRTAKSLGLAPAPSLLAGADEVIE
jgi:putative ABC transport system substrate-binding protein